MRHRSSLSGGVGGFSWRAAQVSGSAHRVSTSGTGLHHGNFTAHPGARLLNRMARTLIIGLHLLKVMQDVRRAVRRPDGKQAMVVIL
jgi:hypothetical protein